MPIDQTPTPQSTHDQAKAALEQIQRWLNNDRHVTDKLSYVICSNDIADDAYDFIRNNLDLNGANLDDFYYPHLTTAIAQTILDDLRIIWDYEYFRDELSQIAMTMSLCPLHFIDWAACFDDDDPTCAQIRAAFPHHHDT